VSAPVSRYLARIDEAIAKAGDSVEGDCLRAERAICLARLGKSELAIAQLTEVRNARSRRVSLLLSAWASLADGLVEYFAEASFAPRTKLLRAQALAASGNLAEVDGLSSAWLAQLSFSSHQVSQMEENLRRALAVAPTYRPARARAALVAAQALHFASGFEAAIEWYRAARLDGIEVGDELTINAVVHNMAWHRLYAFRQHILRDGGEASQDAFVGLSGESYRNYDEFLGVTTFDQMEPMFQAEYFALVGRPGDALTVWRDSLSDLAPDARDRWQSHMLACYGWCKAATGDIVGASETAAQAQATITDKVQVDDLAASYSYLARLYSLVGDAHNAHEARVAADTTWVSVESLQGAFRDAMRRIASP
jgi:tetratricopeptide (TPR) repeat protein